MRVKTILEKIEAEAYPPLSDSKGLFVKYVDEAIAKAKNKRWDYWPIGTFEIIEEDK